MMISFSKGGRYGKAAADYMLDESDHKGMARAGVRVLRGDPYLTAQIADSLDYSRNYSAGIIAWAPNEQPTEAEIDEVLNDFEKLAFAGLNQDQYSWSAVLHEDDRGGVHIHFLIAQIELDSRKRYNPAPPGWQKQGFDDLRDHHNYKNGWSSPKDKANRKLLTIGKSQGTNAEMKQMITDYLVNRIEVGLIKDRDDIIESLKEAGEVTRVGKNYISVKPVGKEKAIRMKGLLYEQEFSRDTISEIAEAARARSSRGGRVDAELAGEALTEYQTALKKRAEYNQQRYSKAETEAMAETINSRPDDLAGHLDRVLGDSAISNKRDIADYPTAPKPPVAKTTINKDNATDSDKSMRTSQRAVREDRRIRTRLQQWLSDIGAAITKRLKRDKQREDEHQQQQEQIQQLRQRQAEQEAQAAIDAAKRKQEKLEQVREEEPELTLRL